MRPLARSYLQHARRHGPKGSDPILELTNDWMTTNVGLSVLNTTTTPVPFTSITYQTDDGSVFAPLTATIDSIQIKQVGSYIVRLLFQFPAVAGSASVAGIIGGDCTTYTYNDYSSVQPLQFYDATGNPYLTWEQLVVVNDLTAPTAVYGQVEQTTGATRSVVVFLQIFRLT